jgi:hypothetical protein
MNRFSTTQEDHSITIRKISRMHLEIYQCDARVNAAKYHLIGHDECGQNKRTEVFQKGTKANYRAKFVLTDTQRHIFFFDIV